MLSTCTFFLTSIIFWSNGQHGFGNSGMAEFWPQLCPVVDCSYIFMSLPCDHADTYITTIHLYEQECTGCPACRDYTYFTHLTRDITEYLQQAAGKLDREMQILDNSTKFVERLISLQDGNSDHYPWDKQLLAQSSELLEMTIEQLTIYIHHPGVIKATRYLEENVQEINGILKNNFKADRMNSNTMGYFTKIGITKPLPLSDQLPPYEQHRYNEILQDLYLDKLSQLKHRTLVIEKLIDDYNGVMKNISDIDEDNYNEMRQNGSDTSYNHGLILRRMFQLLESSKKALSVYIAANTKPIEELIDQMVTILDQLENGQEDQVSQSSVNTLGRNSIWNTLMKTTLNT